MNAPFTLRPDRWLLCTPGVGRATLRAWIADEDSPGLASLREQSAHVLEIEFSEAQAEVEKLLQDDKCGMVHLIVAELDVDALKLQQRLSTARLRVCVYGWYDDVLRVVASLNSPEAAIVDEWVRQGKKPRNFSVEGEQTEWRDRYIAALDRWAEAFREQSPEEFEELFKAVPVADNVRQALALLGIASEDLARAAVRRAADDAAGIVRMLLGRTANAGGGYTGGHRGVAFAAGSSTGSPTVPVLRRWDAGEGAVVTIRQPDADGSEPVNGGEFELCVILDAPLESASRILHVQVKLGDCGVSIDPDLQRVVWVDSGDGGALASTRTAFTAELMQAVLDPEADAEVTLSGRPTRDPST